ncbi:hypothetical protein FRC17_007347 [Serendipita sp. 399]|nr:hypothetical protein FRC17_007347 [Serendipita sp. 399]
MVKTAIVDDMDPNIVYGGDGWVSYNQVYSPATNEYNSTMHYASFNGLTIRYNFRGTGITVYGTISLPCCNGMPSSTYSIDGGPAVRFNSTRDVPYPDVKVSYSHLPFYRSPTLPYGDHSIFITVDNLSDEAKRRYFFDYFAVEGVQDEDNAQGSGGDGPGYAIVDDRDGRVSYSGGWTQSGTTTNYLGTTTSSPNGQRGTASFSFTGTSISVYARTFDNYGKENLAQFIIDAGTDHEVVAYGQQFATTDRRHHPLLIMEGLRDGPHTMQVVALGDRVPQWHLDYFVYGTAGRSGGLKGATIAGSGTSGGGPSTPAGGGGGGSGAGGTLEDDVSVAMITSNGVVITSTRAITNLNPPAFTSDPSIPIGGGGGSGSSSGSAVVASTKTDTAVIAGATIGGVALLSLFTFLVIYMTRRRVLMQSRRNSRRGSILGSGSYGKDQEGGGGGGDESYTLAESGRGADSTMRSMTPSSRQQQNIAGVGVRAGGGGGSGGDDRYEEDAPFDREVAPPAQQHVQFLQQRPARLAPPRILGEKSSRLMGLFQSRRPVSGATTTNVSESGLVESNDGESLHPVTEESESVVLQSPTQALTRAQGAAAAAAAGGLTNGRRAHGVDNSSSSSSFVPGETTDGDSLRNLAQRQRARMPAWVTTPSMTPSLPESHHSDGSAGAIPSAHASTEKLLLLQQSQQQLLPPTSLPQPATQQTPAPYSIPVPPPQQQQQQQQQQRTQTQYSHFTLQGMPFILPRTTRGDEDVPDNEREVDAGIRLDPSQLNFSHPDLLPPSYFSTTYQR